METLDKQTYYQNKINLEFAEFINKHKQNGIKLYRNGYDKRVIDGMCLNLPRVRTNKYNIQFYPSCFNKNERYSKEICKWVIDLYTSNVSMSQISQLFKRRGINISRQTISRIITKHCSQYDNQNKSDLSNKHFDCLFIDGTWERVNNKYYVVMLVCGYSKSGKELIYKQRFENESLQTYESIYHNLVERGLEVPELWVSDYSGGIVAFMTKYPQFKHQRCIVHFIRDLCKFIKRTKHKKTYSRELKEIFYNSNSTEIKDRVLNFITKHSKHCKKTCELLRDTYQSVLTFCNYDTRILPHHTIKTNNIMECINGIIKRRTKTIRNFKSIKTLDNIYTLMYNKLTQK